MLVGHCLKIEMSDIQRYFYLLSERLWNSLWCGSCGHKKTSTGAEDSTPLWNLSANCAGTVSGVYCMSHFIWEIACFNALHVKLVTGIFSDDSSAAHSAGSLSVLREFPLDLTQILFGKSGGKGLFNMLFPAVCLFLKIFIFLRSPSAPFVGFLWIKQGFATPTRKWQFNYL